MPPTKPSGAEFRKRKRLKEDENKTQVLLQWTKSHPFDTKIAQGVVLPSTSQEEYIFDKEGQKNDLPSVSASSEDLEVTQYEETSELPNENFELETTLQSPEKSNNANEYSVDLNDPMSWFPINDSIRCFLVEQGPDRGKNLSFSQCDTLNNRKFSSDWFTRKLANGQCLDRTWLMYSRKREAIFCFPCLLFNNYQALNNPAVSSLASPGKGFSDWRHLSPRVPDHEKTAFHLENVITWKTLEKNLKNKCSIDSSIQSAIDHEKEKWRHILKVHISLILFCAENNLALRGSCEKIGQLHSGIFLGAIDISKYNSELRSHIESHKRGQVSYFSPLIQNEIIELMGNTVKRHIIEEVKTAKYFSILFDCTPDVSHHEQMSQILRFVKVSDGQVSVEERFIDFMHSHEKTGEGLAKEIVQKLEEDGLSITDIRGQGYDNGSNMSGKYSGVQARLQGLNKQAQFVPCAAHSLNLAGVHAASVTPGMVTFFETVQKVFTFFSGSTIRWEILMKHLKTSLKCHSDTRWSSKAKAVAALYTQIVDVVAALTDLTSTSFNVETIANAKVILKYIDFKFLCTLNIWSRILSAIDKINKNLQSKNITTDMAAKMIEGVCKQIQGIRNEDFQIMFETQKVTADEISIESDFLQKRRKRIKRQDMDESFDANFDMIEKEKFQMEMFQVIDTLLAHFKWRFEKLNGIAEDFGFLTITSLKNTKTADLKKKSMDLALKYDNDIDAVGFLNEIESLKFQISEILPKNSNSTSSLNLIQALHDFCLVENFPNVEVAVKIFLTLPVTTASCERSFSKLKLIKTYLRSTMGQERLSKLAILSIEYSLGRQLGYNNIVDEFASRKGRKVNF